MARLCAQPGEYKGENLQLFKDFVRMFKTAPVHTVADVLEIMRLSVDLGVNCFEVLGDYEDYEFFVGKGRLLSDPDLSFKMRIRRRWRSLF
jgi:hypothetical protein